MHSVPGLGQVKYCCVRSRDSEEFWSILGGESKIIAEGEADGDERLAMS